MSIGKYEDEMKDSISEKEYDRLAMERAEDKDVPRETSKIKLDNLYAWIGTTGAGNEQLLNIAVGQTQFPAVRTSFEGAMEMKAMMEGVRDKSGVKPKLVKFKLDKVMREL
jgi:ABC-type uncharacterized transport system ATPase subunit